MECCSLRAKSCGSHIVNDGALLKKLNVMFFFEDCVCLLSNAVDIAFCFNNCHKLILDGERRNGSYFPNFIDRLNYFFFDFSSNF